MVFPKNFAGQWYGIPIDPVDTRCGIKDKGWTQNSWEDEKVCDPYGSHVVCDMHRKASLRSTALSHTGIRLCRNEKSMLIIYSTAVEVFDFHPGIAMVS
jgi:hypothetical protein